MPGPFTVKPPTNPGQPLATFDGDGNLRLAGNVYSGGGASEDGSVVDGGSAAAPGVQVIWMDALGADHTGTTPVTSIFDTQLAAQNGAACLFVFGVGTYAWGSTAPNSLGKDQSVMGLGSRVTRFTWSGAGPLFTATEAAVSGTWTGGDRAGAFSGFSIDGPSGTSGTAGIKYGALQGIRVDDVGFYELDGPAIEGYQVTAGVDWAEEAELTRLDISECGATSGAVFKYTGTSFDYSRLDCLVVVEKNIDVVSLNSGAQWQGGQIDMRGNLHGGLTNTGAVIAIERGNSTGTGYMTNVPMNISMECNQGSDTGTLGHYTLWLGSSSQTSQFSAFGTLRANAAGATSQGISNVNFLLVSFAGNTHEQGGGAPANGTGLAVLGATRWNPANDGFTTLYQNNIYWEFGDVITALLVSGAQTLIFNGADSFITRGRLFLKQPASGSAATVTWPASVVWLGGTAPTLATTNGYVDEFECMYLPKETQWRLSHVGTYDS